MAPRFHKLDAFAKTIEDARVRTASGGIVTVFSFVVIFFLIVTEWRDYRTIVLRPELVVDKGRGDQMEIHMNISFPRIPCDLLTLDVGDASGDIQLDVLHGMKKVRLASVQQGGRPIETSDLELHKADAVHLAPDYCGDCYGAHAPEDATKKGCCNSCDEVRRAYAAASWAFGRGENVEQCNREHYSEQLEQKKHEGCRMEGAVRVNKVPGSFHFVPGRSFTRGSLHLHDLENYGRTDGPHTPEHHIHSLRFGPQLPAQYADALTNALKSSPDGAFSNSLLDINPLDRTSQKTGDKMYSYSYFIKVVSTVFLPLNTVPVAPLSKDVPVGMYGLGSEGEVETHQYSVTMHQRNLAGGSDGDNKGGHEERTHARGGLPGVFVEYDISPIKVINRQVRPKSFVNFLTAACAAIGGTLTVAAAVDRLVYEGQQRTKRSQLRD